MSRLAATLRAPLIRIAAVDRAWLAVGIVLAAVALVAGDRLGEFVVFTGEQLLATAPFIVFAVLLVAGLKAGGAEAALARAFEGKEIRMIVFAALLGGLAPFCSCEVIPFIAGLLAMGTPLSAVMAFWLSSPLIDPPALLITAAIGAMVLAHIERRKEVRMDQVATLKARFRPGSYPGPKPGPGVYATSSSVATPARLPDGRLTERSTSDILPVRELTAEETTLKGTEK